MAVGRDDAVVTDAFISATSGGGSESRIIAGSAFFINVEAEAGTSAILNGDAYNLLVLLQDITNFANLVIVSFSGNLGPTAGSGTLVFSSLVGASVTPPPPFNTANTDTPFSISVPAPGVPSGTILKLLALVALGTAQQDVESFESELILVTT